MTFKEKFGTPLERNWGDLREARGGVMLHYDASTSDTGALTWLFKDPRCGVSYNFMVMDDGEVVPHAPADKRAWHAGVCRPSNPALPYKDANSFFYGIAVAANHREKVTSAQYDAVVSLVTTLFREHRWKEDYRIVGHNTEACFEDGRRGRKDDPDGKLGKVLVVSDVRLAVAALMKS